MSAEFEYDAPGAAEETKQERKARLKQEKADAKAQAKADREVGQEADQSLSAKWERYNQLRANVRRRRAGYVLIILLAIAVFLGTAWDIVYNASDFKLFFFAAYGVLFLWGIVMLFSRRRHLQEILELEAMHRTYLECEHCNAVFQFGELRFKDRKRVGFSCPVCSEDSALPGPDSIPVERVLPEAQVVETTYACGNCDEQIVVGTFGATPRASRFQACPSCGVSGHVNLA